MVGNFTYVCHTLVLMFALAFAVCRVAANKGLIQSRCRQREAEAETPCIHRGNAADEASALQVRPDRRSRQVFRAIPRLYTASLGRRAPRLNKTPLCGSTTHVAGRAPLAEPLCRRIRTDLAGGNGWQVGDWTYKVHLDGYNQLPHRPLSPPKPGSCHPVSCLSPDTRPGYRFVAMVNKDMHQRPHVYRRTANATVPVSLFLMVQ
jgi:hypothetical protein